MANRNKAKGTAFESEVVKVLKPAFPHAERRAQAGSLDKGDIAGVHAKSGTWVLECKNQARIELAQFLDEAKQEAVNADADRYAAVIKRRGKPAAEAYVVLPLSEFVSLIGDEA